MSENPVSIKVRNGYKDSQCAIALVNKRVVGNGTFGVVHGAVIADTGVEVAIKRVFQDTRYKNRELQIMKMLQHPNIISLLYYYKQKDNKGEIYLNLIMDFFPETVFDLIRQHKHNSTKISHRLIRLYSYQMMRGLSYMHRKNIVHRDIKPTNLLIDNSKVLLKICDFGSAKMLNAGQPNVAYICSRYYRAPELVIGAVNYSFPIDVWSAGCVMAELATCKPIFAGANSLDQLVEIIKVLGSPSSRQVLDMNSDYREFKFPRASPTTLDKILGLEKENEFVGLLQLLFEYSPQQRLTAVGAMGHAYFSSLRERHSQSNQQQLGGPDEQLFNFTQDELQMNPSLQNLVTGLKKL